METQRSIKLVMGGGPKAAKLGQPGNTKGKNGEEVAKMRLGDLVEADRDNPSTNENSSTEVARADNQNNDATTTDTETPRDRLTRAFQEMNGKLQAFNAQIEQGRLAAQQAQINSQLAKQQQGTPPMPKGGSPSAPKGSSPSPKKSSSNNDVAKLKKELADAKKDQKETAEKLKKAQKGKTGDSKDSKDTETNGRENSETGDRDPNRRIDGISNADFERYEKALADNNYQTTDSQKDTLKALVEKDARFEPLLEKVNAQERRDGKRDTEGIDADDALGPDELDDDNSFNPDELDDVEDNEEVEEPPEPEIEIDDSEEE